MMRKHMRFEEDFFSPFGAVVSCESIDIKEGPLMWKVLMAYFIPFMSWVPFISFMCRALLLRTISEEKKFKKEV